MEPLGGGAAAPLAAAYLEESECSSRVWMVGLVPACCDACGAADVPTAAAEVVDGGPPVEERECSITLIIRSLTVMVSLGPLAAGPAVVTAAGGRIEPAAVGPEPLGGGKKACCCCLPATDEGTLAP